MRASSNKGMLYVKEVDRKTLDVQTYFKKPIRCFLVRLFKTTYPNAVIKEFEEPGKRKKERHVIRLVFKKSCPSVSSIIHLLSAAPSVQEIGTHVCDTCRKNKRRRNPCNKS